MNQAFLPAVCLLLLGWFAAVLFLRPLYAQWVNHHPVQATAMCLLMLVLVGVVGGGFGLSNLFWHEDIVTQLVSGASLAALALAFWALNLSLNRATAYSPYRASVRRWRALRWLRRKWGLRVPLAYLRVWRARARRVAPYHGTGAALAVSAAQYRRYLMTMFVPFGVLLILLCLLRTAEDIPGATAGTRWGAYLPLPLGAWAIAVIVYAVLRVQGRFGSAWDWWGRRGVFARVGLALACVNAPAVLLWGIGAWWPEARTAVTAVLAVTTVLGTGVLLILLLAHWTRNKPFARVIAVCLLAVVVGMLNGDPYKLTYPGLEDYYDEAERSAFVHKSRVPTPDAARLPSEAARDDEPNARLREKARISARYILGARITPNPMQRENFTERVAELDTELREGKSGPVYLYRSVLRLQNGDAAGAVDDARIAMELTPKVFATRQQLAKALFATKLPGAVEREIREEFPRQDGGESWKWPAMEGLMERHYQNRPSSAESYYNEALQLHHGTDLQSLSERAQLHSELAEVYDELKKFAQATQQRQAAARLYWIANELSQPASSKATAPAGVSPLIDDRECLNSWRRSQKTDKPVLVVVATSGGGIAAGYWTTRCLTRITERCPEFPDRLRLVTGASGGMFGAGVYVARLGDEGGPRPEDSPTDVAKDCLTPVVRRMALADLPSILVPARQSNDRGRELERAWAGNTGGSTAKTFAELRLAEREGRRPSLIVSPMLVEDARFLLISNLDLDGLGDGEELFKHFPRARDKFQLGTALRMNASFPYVSPAVSLPTKVPRRVVDAGYLDNYGVSLACDWLELHKAWLWANTGGVVLIQLRAYSTAAADMADASASTRNDLSARLAAGWEFLGTPFEGVLGARAVTMFGRNNARVTQVGEWFNEGEGRSGFFKTIELECGKSVPLGWSLTGNDRLTLDAQLEERSEKITEICKAIRKEIAK